jgi:hypothetical protein
MEKGVSYNERVRVLRAPLESLEKADMVKAKRSLNRNLVCHHLTSSIQKGIINAIVC